MVRQSIVVETSKTTAITLFTGVVDHKVVFRGRSVREKSTPIEPIKSGDM